MSLRDYSSNFDAIEIQSSFYRLPRLQTARRWREIVPESFEFSLKAFQGITHPTNSPTWRKSIPNIRKDDEDKVGLLRDNDLTRKWREDTMAVAAALQAKVVAVQLPPSFDYNEENISRIKSFLRASKGRCACALEVRNRTWMDRLDELAALVRRVNAILITDPLKAKPPVQRTQYHRLHGMDGFVNYGHRYDDDELRRLARILQDEEDVYVFFNNISMRDDAMRLRRILSE